MTTTREQLVSVAYETEDEVVIELELPGDVAVDADRATATIREGTLELRLPKRPERAELAGSKLRGFHPDAAPS